MNGERHSIRYGHTELGYTLCYVERKTLEIAVHPTGEIVVKAPAGACLEVVEKKVLKRTRWILRQIEYFKQFTPKEPTRSYIGGETHLYLGRRYRLKITDAGPRGVKLSGGFFHVSTAGDRSPGTVKKLLERWYRDKAVVQYHAALERCWPAFATTGLMKPRLRIARMKTRWGSLSKNKQLSLNPELIKAPRECIDYVVTHELCHLKHRNHSPEFYALLERVLPNWKKIKHKLELALA